MCSNNAPNASLRLKVIQEISIEDLKLRNRQEDKERALRGLGLRMGKAKWIKRVGEAVAGEGETKSGGG